MPPCGIKFFFWVTFGSFDIYAFECLVITLAYLCINKNNFHLILLIYSDLVLHLFLNPEMLYYFRRYVTI